MGFGLKLYLGIKNIIYEFFRSCIDNMICCYVFYDYRLNIKC